MAFDLHDALSEPESVEHFCQLMETLCRAVGMENFLAACIPHAEAGRTMHLLHNGQGEAVERITIARHPSVDQLIAAARQSPAPVLFGEGGEPGADVPGYRCGISANVYGAQNRHILFFGSDALAVPPAMMVDLMADVQLAAVYGDLGMAKLFAEPCPLTARELQCLAYSQVTSSAAETAALLGISTRTVEHHLEKARVRLQVGSTAAAALLAIRKGWLDLKPLRAQRAA